MRALLLGTAGSGESASAATNRVQRAGSAAREPTNRCHFRAVFAALEELRGIQALCLTSLPAGEPNLAQPSGSFVTSRPTGAPMDALSVETSLRERNPMVVRGVVTWVRRRSA
jgi:hypothetical protein